MAMSESTARNYVCHGEQGEPVLEPVLRDRAGRAGTPGTTRSRAGPRFLNEFPLRKEREPHRAGPGARARVRVCAGPARERDGLKAFGGMASWPFDPRSHGPAWS